jgi:ribosome-binding protein aMBF1 (putative translation factor)
MLKNKRKKLEGRGWKVGSPADFLELNEEEAALVELRLNLSDQLRELRTKNGLSQVELARRIGSSQSRVAKMEASDPSVSIDLLMKGLFAVGASQQQIGKALAKPQARRAGKVGTRGNAA